MDRPKPRPSEAKISRTERERQPEIIPEHGHPQAEDGQRDQGGAQQARKRVKPTYLPVRISPGVIGETRNSSTTPRVRSRTIESAPSVTAICCNSSAMTPGYRNSGRSACRRGQVLRLPEEGGGQDVRVQLLELRGQPLQRCCTSPAPRRHGVATRVGIGRRATRRSACRRATSRVQVCHRPAGSGPDSGAARVLAALVAGDGRGCSSCSISPALSATASEALRTWLACWLALCTSPRCTVVAEPGPEQCRCCPAPG